MSNFLVALFMALGSGTWIYSKTYKTTGGQTQKAVIVGVICGAIVLLVAWTLLDMIFS